MVTGDLILPEEKRAVFKVHLGTYIEENVPGDPERRVKEKIALLTPPIVITVGDICTEKLIEAGFTPNIAITDRKTRRGYRNPITICGALELQAANPPGMITQEAWMVIRKAINKQIESTTPIHIHIQGEEDLLAIPVVLEAPSKALVIYGQPEVEGQIKRGLVCIEVSEEVKRRARGFIELMEKSEP